MTQELLSIKIDSVADFDYLLEFAIIADAHFEREEAERADELGILRAIDPGHGIPQPLRGLVSESCIIMGGSLFEERLNSLSQLIERTVVTLPESAKRNGNIVNRFQSLCKAKGLTELPDPSDASGVICLRNCLVHHAHDLDSFAANRPLQETELREFCGTHSIQIVKNRWVKTDLPTVEMSVKILRDYLEGIFDAITKDSRPKPWR